MGIFNWIYKIRKQQDAPTSAQEKSYPSSEKSYPSLDSVMPRWIGGELLGYKCRACGHTLCSVGEDGKYHLCDGVEFLREYMQVSVHGTKMIMHIYRCPHCKETLNARMDEYNNRHVPMFTTCDVMPPTDEAVVFFNPSSDAQEAMNFHGFDWYGKITEFFPYINSKRRARFFKKDALGALILGDAQDD